MSRVGKEPITIPSGVTITIEPKNPKIIPAAVLIHILLYVSVTIGVSLTFCTSNALSFAALSFDAVRVILFEIECHICCAWCALLSFTNIVITCGPILLTRTFLKYFRRFVLFTCVPVSVSTLAPMSSLSIKPTIEFVYEEAAC